MTVIKDGTGTGYLAMVNSENRLITTSVSESIDSHINQIEGQSYSVVVSQTPAGANNCFCYIKNLSTSAKIFITSVKLYTATDETIQVKLKDSGTTAGGTIYVPVNRNSGSTNSANALVEVGNNITGLAGGLVVDQFFIEGATTTNKFDWDSGLVVDTNQIISFYAVTGSIAVKMSVGIYFDVE